MLAANVVAPGRAQSLPLPPEFVRPQDGAAKQDCERQAVKRWLARHGPRCAALRPVYLGDDLYACQPVCRAMLDAGGDFLLTCKQPSHKTLYEYLDGIRLPTRRRTAGRGAKRRIHRYRWMNDLPIRDGDDALRVNWLKIVSSKPDGTVTYRGAFATSLDVNRGNVAELADCARARWKIENETFNVLKQHGYHLEHNFGHGRSLCHETADIDLDNSPGEASSLFEHLRTVTEYQVFTSWTALMTRHRRTCGTASLTSPPRLRNRSTRRKPMKSSTVTRQNQNENCWSEANFSDGSIRYSALVRHRHSGNSQAR